jgi:hypothetical protein
MTVCVEAVNDQIECPRYRKNPAAANQSFGVHFSPPPPPPQSLSSATTIATSQASEAFCFLLEVKGPELEFLTPSPAENAEVMSYAACPLTLTLASLSHSPHTHTRVLDAVTRRKRRGDVVEEYVLPPHTRRCRSSCRMQPAPSHSHSPHPRTRLTLTLASPSHSPHTRLHTRLTLALASRSHSLL